MIKTKRLFLRKFKDSDVEKIALICNDFDVAKYTINIPVPYTIEDAKSWLSHLKTTYKTKEFLELAVTLKENTQEVIGCVGLLKINPRSQHAEIGYWFEKKHWNKGYATEAVTALIKYAFETLNLKSLQARHVEANPASGRVMQKCGMTYVGVMRNYETRFGEWHNVHYYDIIREDVIK